ncbi:hypothetical protein CSW41_09000, partial [Thermus scotoductus]
MDAAGPVGWTVWAIRQGDTSNHGGLVQSGAPKVLIVGLPAARVGDLHACPITGHGITPIVSGSAKVLIAGAPAMRTLAEPETMGVMPCPVMGQAWRSPTRAAGSPTMRTLGAPLCTRPPWLEVSPWRMAHTVQPTGPAASIYHLLRRQ